MGIKKSLQNIHKTEIKKKYIRKINYFIILFLNFEMAVPCSINQKTVIENIAEAINSNNKNLDIDQGILEVEGKLGFINMSGLDNFTRHMMEEFSYQNYLDLNSLKNLKKNFVSGQIPKKFHTTLQYFEDLFELSQKIDFVKLKESEKKSHDYFEKFKNFQEVISVDYLFEEGKGKKTRFSVDPFNGKNLHIEKCNKNHFDLFHNSI